MGAVTACVLAVVTYVLALIACLPGVVACVLAAIACEGLSAESLILEAHTSTMQSKPTVCKNPVSNCVLYFRESPSRVRIPHAYINAYCIHFFTFY